MILWELGLGPGAQEVRHGRMLPCTVWMNERGLAIIGSVNYAPKAVEAADNTQDGRDKYVLEARRPRHPVTCCCLPTRTAPSIIIAHHVLSALILSRAVSNYTSLLEIVHKLGCSRYAGMCNRILNY